MNLRSKKYQHIPTGMIFELAHEGDQMFYLHNTLKVPVVIVETPSSKDFLRVRLPVMILPNGTEVFDNQKYYYCYLDSNYQIHETTVLEQDHNSGWLPGDNAICFGTMEEAEQWVRDNKPVYPEKLLSAILQLMPLVKDGPLSGQRSEAVEYIFKLRDETANKKA